MPCLCQAHILVQESFNTQDPNINKWYLPKKEQRWGKGTDRKGEGGKGGGSRIKFWSTDQKRKGGKQSPAEGECSRPRKKYKGPEAG